MEEKRKHLRVQKRIKSEVRSDQGITLSATFDMSHGGLFITTPEPMGEGSEVELSLYIPGEEPVNMKGTIRWKREDESDQIKAGMGIEFIDASDETIKKLKKHFG
ncbi:MAG TPA: TIGR02266 family protein [Spirochaetota bacterium]|nr:TIGR02266 family protein [Spirochaetota bacterium]